MEAIGDAGDIFDNRTLPPRVLDTNLVGQFPLMYPIGLSAFIGLLLSVITIVCVVGNALVVVAVLTVKQLHTPSNYLIVSLAVSDLLVGVVVMPLSVAYELTGKWTLGERVCSMWITFDVTLCTASILNLTMISIDRYLVINYPFSYSQNRNWKYALRYIGVAWGLSFLTAIIPFLVGWNVKLTEERCVVNQDLGFQIYATLVAFYIPLVIMIALYGRIFYISAKMAAKDALNRPAVMEAEHLTAVKHSESVVTQSPNGKVRSATTDTDLNSLTGGNNNNTIGVSHPKHSHSFDCAGSFQDMADDGASADFSSGVGDDAPKNGAANGEHRPAASDYLNECGHRKSRRRWSVGNGQAIKTLGVIMGLFTACWLPFFILAVIRSICDSAGACHIPEWLSSLLTWLGYANSFFNPFVYARFNRQFRTPFKELICCRWTTINESVRHSEYLYRYGS